MYFATTSTTSEQTLISIEAGDISGVEYLIISTDPTANVRNLVRLSVVKLGTQIFYTEFNTLPINGSVGDFSVEYDAGPPETLQLKIIPSSSNLITHKMSITSYRE